MSNYTIQTGFWVNNDYDPVQGATLTVSVRWGNYIIAALSSLVAWSGSRAWSILYFYLHQRLARKRDGKDVLHHQLQVHYRAQGSFFDSLVDGFDLHRAWRGRLKRVKRRTLSLVFGALLFFLAFAAAGILVAEVVSQSNQELLVLATPNDCGDFHLQDSATSEKQHNDWLDQTTQYQSDAQTWSRNYARDAYNGTKARFDSFAQAALPVSGREVACPYAEGTTCLGVNATRGAPAWLMETGPLDSHVHFGINAPAGDRITFNKSVTCAVVDVANLTTRVYSRLESIRGVAVNKSYIGVLQQFGEDIGADSNLAFEVPTSLVNERVGYVNQRANYQMGVHDPDKDLTGAPFQRYDADVVLSLTSQSRMFYYAPVDDPLFLAHEAFRGEEYAYDMNATVYYPSIPFGLLVCSEQSSVCNPTSGKCTSPNGTLGWRDQVLANEIGLNPAQWTTALRMLYSASSVGAFVGQFAARGNQGLLVAETRGVRAGASIPPTQWRKEVNLWFASSLTSLQSGLLNWIAKPWPAGRPDTMGYTTLNATMYTSRYDTRGLRAQMDRQCENQLIRSAEAMQNFSVLALVLVIFICVVIITAAWLLPCCVTSHRERIERRGSANGGAGGLSAAAEAAELARLADGKFSLLAMTLANAGVGRWERGRADIPVTATKVPATCLPLVRTDSGLAAYPGAMTGEVPDLEYLGEEKKWRRKLVDEEKDVGLDGARRRPETATTTTSASSDAGTAVAGSDDRCGDEAAANARSRSRSRADCRGAGEKESDIGGETESSFDGIRRADTAKTLVEPDPR